MPKNPIKVEKIVKKWEKWKLKNPSEMGEEKIGHLQKKIEEKNWKIIKIKLKKKIKK